MPIAGRTFTDAGSHKCHGSPRDRVLEMGRPGRKLSRSGTMKVRLECTAGCNTSTRVSVKVGKRTIRSARVRRTLFPLTRATVRVKFARRNHRAIRRAFRRHTRLHAEVRARASVLGTERTGSAKASLRLRR